MLKYDDHFSVRANLACQLDRELEHFGALRERGQSLPGSDQAFFSFSYSA